MRFSRRQRCCLALLRGKSFGIIRFGSDTPELAPAWLESGTGLWPVGPGDHGRDARATEERITAGRRGWLGFNASALAPGIFTATILEIRCGPIEFVDIIQEDAGAVGHGGKRVVGHCDGEAGFFRKKFVDAADE